MEGIDLLKNAIGGANSPQPAARDAAEARLCSAASRFRFSNPGVATRGFGFAALPWFCLFAGIASGEWRAQQAPLMTRWAKDVTPDNVHPEYPRPQLVRQAWMNLNGLWDYRIQPREGPRPERFDGKILVPFPVEAALSGVMQPVGPEQKVWYRRTFDLPAGWSGQRVLLHFGAVDWEATVSINGRDAGTHRGGYDPFAYDITDLLNATGPQEIVVAVWDPTTTGPQPRGKQHLQPEGIWYTSTTGIWQTVWLEPVPPTYIRGMTITSDPDDRSVTVQADVAGKVAGWEVEAAVSIPAKKGSKPTALTVREPVGRPLRLECSAEAPLRLWTPDTPVLYDVAVKLKRAGQAATAPAADSVQSYFAMRKVSIGAVGGVTRILLNDEPVFQLGLLDQGFWPDGLYTAPTDDALRYDLEMTKKLGFNLVRKHVKVEPARWYYWCDRLGLLVWQDFPSGDRHVKPGEGEIERSAESREIFERELRAMIDARRHFPSIVMWVPFNEGWGQFDTVRISRLIKARDPTRLVNCASGWNDFPAGDVHDIHKYPGPDAPIPEKSRAAVLGEFGGLGLAVAGHTWQAEKNWGYKSFVNKDDLARAYFERLTSLAGLIAEPGLSAAVYTQTTDVETEINGLVTYDREMLKLPADALRRVHRKLCGDKSR
ncbi:MAG: glycoside hydrolase family 2 protein [Planctomycetaceae bacterium]